MSGNYDDALNSLLKLAKPWRAINELAPALEKLGSLNAALINKQAELDNLRADEDVAKLRVSTAFEAANQAEIAADEIRAKGQTDADALVASGQASADKIVATAQASAKQTMADASDRAAAVSAASEEAQNKLDAVTGEIADLSAKRDDIKMEIDGLLARLK